MITKLDLMDDGTDARDVLENKVLPLRRGNELYNHSCFFLHRWARYYLSASTLHIQFAILDTLSHVSCRVFVAAGEAITADLFSCLLSKI